MMSRTIMMSLIGMIILMIKINTITMKRTNREIMTNIIGTNMLPKIALFKTEEIIRGLTSYQALEKIISTRIIGRIVSTFPTRKKAITKVVTLMRRK